MDTAKDIGLSMRIVSIIMMLGSKVFDPLIPTDFSAFHAHEILKTFAIRSFFLRKMAACSCFAGPIDIKYMQAYILCPFVSWLIIIGFVYEKLRTA